MLPKAMRTIVRDVRRIPTGVKLVVLVLFLRAIGWGFADPFFSIFIERLSQNYTVVGLLISLMGIVSLLTIIPLLRLADRVKATRIIEDGEIVYFFVILAYTLAGLLKSIPFLLLGLFLNGVAQPLVTVGAEAYIRKHGKGGRSRSFGYYTALDFSGWIIGMFIAAFTIQYYGLNWMFLFVLPSIIASLFILPRIRERGLPSFIKGIRKYFHRRQDFVDLFNDFKSLNPKMIFFFIVAFFDGMIRMFTYIFIPLFAVSIDLSFQQIALLMVVMYSPFIFSFFFSEFTDRQPHKMNVIATGLFIGALSFILLSFIVDQKGILILAAMISLSMAIIRPAYNGMLTRLTPRRMLGELTSLNNLVLRIGQIVGPVITGLLADYYGIQLVFFIIAILAFGLGVITIVLRGYDYLISSA